jgi:DNA-binding NtrC family response regulator
MKRRVLVVDDDAAVRESLGKILVEAGFEVTKAAGGLEAALRFDAGEVDLVLLDLNLPNQSGWDVFEHMTDRQPWIPIVIITGLPNQVRTARMAGVGALFEKPVDAEALLQTIDKLLAQPKQRHLRRLCGYVRDTRYESAAGPPAGS